jgi:DNA-binding HxlR family transcriptional regulator
MAERKKSRSYRQFCGVAKALDVVGERWTLLLVRNLLVGGMRYSDLLASLPGITTNLLAQRLKQLQEAGLIELFTTPPPASATLYQLTAAGRELEPVVLALGRFGARYLEAPPHKHEHTNVRWMMVSLMRRYRGVKHAATLGVHVGDDHHYVLRLGEQRLEVSEGSASALDAELRCTPAAFRALLMGGAGLDALVEQGAITIEGQRRVAASWARAVGAAV